MKRTLTILFLAAAVIAVVALIGCSAPPPGASGQLTPSAAPAESATSGEAPYQVAVVDMNKIVTRHRDYSQLLAIQERINTLARSAPSGSQMEVNFAATGQADLMRQQQSAGAEMQQYVNYTREMLKLKQKGANEELMVRERKLREDLNQLYQQAREEIQKEMQGDIRRKPSPTPTETATQAPAPPPKPVETPKETAAPPPQPEPEPEPPEEEVPEETATPQPQEAYNPADDPEFQNERKAIQKKMKAMVDDLLALRDRQAAARKLELEKSLSERLGAKKRELDRQYAEYEGEVLKANQNAKLNLQLKIMNSSSEEEHAKYREELSRISQEESSKKDARRSELGRRYEEHEAAEKAKMEEEFNRYKEDLGKQIKDKVAAEEKRLEEQLHRKFAAKAARTATPAPAVTPRPKRTRTPRPSPTQPPVASTPVPLPTLTPSLPQPATPSATPALSLEGAKFNSPKIRRRYEEKKKALIAEFEAYKRQLGERLQRDGQVSNLQLKGKELELKERVRAYQQSIISEFQEKSKAISRKELDRRKKVQAQIDDLLKQKNRLIESITAEMREKVSLVAQREGFNLVVASYITNVHCTDLTDYILQELDGQAPGALPPIAPSPSAPASAPAVTITPGTPSGAPTP